MAVHPVVLMPPDAVVLDLRQPGDFRAHTSRWTIGRYDEDRGIYQQDLFVNGAEPRTVHVGLDLGGPAGVAVHAFADGEVAFAGDNNQPGDYGPTIITRHQVGGAPLWMLHGHLSRASLDHSPVGRTLRAGDVVGWLGTRDENGGWEPHVHIQITRQEPTGPDLPGVVTRAERAAALRRFPNPLSVLGPVGPLAG